jgi:hypothetical protein
VSRAPTAIKNVTTASSRFRRSGLSASFQADTRGKKSLRLSHRVLRRCSSCIAFHGRPYGPVVLRFGYIRRADPMPARGPALARKSCRRRGHGRHDLPARGIRCPHFATATQTATRRRGCPSGANHTPLADMEDNPPTLAQLRRGTPWCWVVCKVELRSTQELSRNARFASRKLDSLCSGVYPQEHWVLHLPRRSTSFAARSVSAHATVTYRRHRCWAA